MQRPPRHHRLSPAPRLAAPGKTWERDYELCHDALSLETGRHQLHAEAGAARPLRPRQRRRPMLAEAENIAGRVRLTERAVCTALAALQQKNLIRRLPRIKFGKRTSD